MLKIIKSRNFFARFKTSTKMSENNTAQKLNEKQVIINNASLLTDGSIDYKLFDEQFNKASIVLLGEASHGTSEFYKIRAKISQKLITDYGFNAVAIEGDWPDVYQINRYVQGITPRNTLNKVFSHFKRFPLWMWRNQPMLDFVKWLKIHNDSSSQNQKVGVYGLDLYSIHSSIEEIIKFLNKEDPAAAIRARDRYKCLDTAIHDPGMYGFLAHMDLKGSCADAVTQQLIELNKKAASLFIQQDKGVEADEYFQIVQNAHLIKSAEAYYRNMFKEEVSTWNLRDKHMFDTLQNIQSYLSKKISKPAKIIIWAHNSHIGNAKATEMGKSGEFNIGQLVKESYGEKSFSIGFTTYSGTVRAASNWGDEGKIKCINPGLATSYEHLFHSTNLENFILALNNSELCTILRKPRLERAIGVIYKPETERMSHYFRATLPDQFDAVCHLDITTAIEPLLEKGSLEEEEVPDTFPSGL